MTEELNFIVKASVNKFINNKGYYISSDFSEKLNKFLERLLNRTVDLTSTNMRSTVQPDTILWAVEDFIKIYGTEWLNLI